MAYKIVWTKRAIAGYDKIIKYLAENWTEKEIVNFVKEADNFFEILAEHPEILQRSGKKENVYRGPINRLTIVIYRLKTTKKQI